MGSVRNKVVTVGDPQVGKTCLLTRFAHGRFPEHYVPTVFETYSTDLMVGREPKELFLWDTTGEDAYARLRVLVYPLTDVILLTFAIDRPVSLLNLQLHWFQEVKYYLPHVPIVMVGLRSDRRNDPDTIARLAAHRMKPVSYDYGKRISSAINAFDYVECSALTGLGVREVFITAVRAVQHARTVRRKRVCKIL